jgi:hypothetical protein
VTDDPDLLEQIRLFLPKYLTPAETKQLWSELSAFPETKNFYLHSRELEEQLLQGDGWRGFIVLDFFTGARKTVSGVILSNSCDISPDNERALPFNVLFSPLIALAKVEGRLGASGLSPIQIQSMLTNIRGQRVTNMFYLPEYSNVIAESVILLDDVHVHPATDFSGCARTSLFTLSQHAFYLFLMKLSIHFSRFQEGVRRFGSAA